MYCAALTCVYSWGMWKRMRAIGCLRLHQCQRFSLSSVTVSGCSKSLRTAHRLNLDAQSRLISIWGLWTSFMSTLTIKALDLTRLDRCDCKYIAHAAGFWIQHHGCGQLPFPRDARLDGCCSRFSVAALIRSVRDGISRVLVSGCWKRDWKRQSKPEHS